MMKNTKKQLFFRIFLNLTIATVIAVTTAKILPLIYVGMRLGVGLIIAKIAV